MAEVSVKPAQSHQFRDIPLFLVLIPIINVLNYYLTYTHIPSGWRLPVTFLIDTVQGYAAWWMLRAIIRRLDHRFPYERNFVRRILLQCVITSVVSLLVIALSTEAINFLATDKPVPRRFYTHDIFIFFIWILAINGIYIGAHFYEQFQQANHTKHEALRVRQEGFIVRSGKQSIAVPFDESIGFYVDGEYTMVLTDQQKRYVVDQSLDKLEDELPGERFFRLNRQYILHRQTLTAFDRLENGKLNVRLKDIPGFPESIQVSRTKAPAFKKWFSPE
ncbi:LytR/AlgR family response regulator transcription factor [Larkinella humicola]|uniref:LytTR family transcriptional regulator n=1 Tax=Larkinella humicola TaxID=2607654 RepID=A0A5N1JGQ6_9BACT|nr:LytTR family DNA-binding domain-containing protein [Larkinella humicola]KAA9349810.1 LytTR family transcriptional regulator [Larkinella humicola]